MKTKLGIIGVVLAAIGLMVLANSLYIVKLTEQALVLQFGRVVEVVREPGLKFKVPMVQEVLFFDQRLLEFNADSKEIIAADQKRLVVDAYMRYRITDPLTFYQTVGDERMMSSRLNPILESALRRVIGNVPLSDMISVKRAKSMDLILKSVNDQVTGKVDADGAPVDAKATGPKNGFGIEVVDVRIMRADLPKENSQNIYRRMQTEREREAKELRAKGAEEAQRIRARADKERTVLLAEAEKTAEILRGEGDAEATRIFAQSFSRDPDFFDFYRSMQAYGKALQKDDTTMILSPESEFLQQLEKGK